MNSLPSSSHRSRGEKIYENEIKYKSRYDQGDSSEKTVHCVLCEDSLCLCIPHLPENWDSNVVLCIGSFGRPQVIRIVIPIGSFRYTYIFYTCTVYKVQAVSISTGKKVEIRYNNLYCSLLLLWVLWVIHDADIQVCIMVRGAFRDLVWAMGIGHYSIQYKIM